MHSYKLPYPPRFRTYEDGKLFLKCCQDDTLYPEENVIMPFIFNGEKQVVNPEYLVAPYEVGYFIQGHEPETLVNT